MMKILVQKPTFTLVACDESARQQNEKEKLFSCCRMHENRQVENHILSRNRRLATFRSKSSDCLSNELYKMQIESRSFNYAMREKRKKHDAATFRTY
jgi:hypothetical protein